MTHKSNIIVNIEKRFKKDKKRISRINNKGGDNAFEPLMVSKLFDNVIMMSSMRVLLL